MNRFQIGHISISRRNKLQLIKLIEAFINTGSGGSVFTATVDHVMMAETNKSLAKAFSKASLVIADSSLLILASKVINTKLHDNTYSSDLLLPLLSLCEGKKLKVFFLGSVDKTVQSAIVAAEQMFHNINIIGHLCPMISSEIDDHEVHAIMSCIMMSRPDIILLDLDSPQQELFMDYAIKYRGKAVMVALGASLRALAGEANLTPVAFQKAGMEWLWRFYQNPKQSYNRYMRNAKFPLVVIKQLLNYKDLR